MFWLFKLIHSINVCSYILAGFFFEPTVFTDVKDNTFLSQEESFGPIMIVSKFEDGWVHVPLACIRTVIKFWVVSTPVLCIHNKFVMLWVNSFNNWQFKGKSNILNYNVFWVMGIIDSPVYQCWNSDTHSYISFA